MESRIALTDRLRREGRWDEANRFKDEKLSELRNDGMTRKEAQPLAWDAMAAKYPPLPREDWPIAEEARAAFKPIPVHLAEHFKALPKMDFFEEVLWVHDNLVLDPEPIEAPSAGAWQLYQFARSDNKAFYTNMLPKAQERQIAMREAAEEVKRRAEEDVIEEEILAAEEIHQEINEMMAIDDEKHAYKQFADEIDGILQELVGEEPIGDAVRGEARRLLEEIPKVKAKYRSGELKPR